VCRRGRDIDCNDERFGCWQLNWNALRESPLRRRSGDEKLMADEGQGEAGSETG